MGKKPTMNQVKLAIDNLILQMSRLHQSVNYVDNVLGGYVKFKGDEENFKEWITQKMKEENEQSKRDSNPKSNQGNKEATREERHSSEGVPSNENVR